MPVFNRTRNKLNINNKTSKGSSPIDNSNQNIGSRLLNKMNSVLRDEPDSASKINQ